MEQKPSSFRTDTVTARSLLDISRITGLSKSEAIRYAINMTRNSLLTARSFSVTAISQGTTTQKEQDQSTPS